MTSERHGRVAIMSMPLRIDAPYGIAAGDKRICCTTTTNIKEEVSSDAHTHMPV